MKTVRTIFGLGLLACALASAQALAAAPAAGQAAARAPRIADAVEQRLAVLPEARVVLLLDVAGSEPSEGGQYRTAVARGQESVLQALAEPDFTLSQRLESFPIISGTLRPGGLARLRSMPGVLRVDPALEAQADLAQSVPLIRADIVQSLGWTGRGVSVAIIDTGIDSTHPDLSDNVDPGQACFCSTLCCPNASSTQLGPGAAEDDNGHGTHVSGIVTSGGRVASKGVAPDANIVAVKVLDASGHSCCMDDVLAGLDWVLVHRPDVQAINISIGSSALYAGDCDTINSTAMGFASILGQLRARGTLTFISAGNNAAGSAMTLPACVSNAISVGAVWDANNGGNWDFGICKDLTTAADKVACFSNSEAQTDLFAPGILITSDWLGGGLANAGGTSMAAPHAAGCAADILQAHPGLSAAALEATLKATGVPVVDPKNNLTFPRIDCLAALQARSCPDADGDGFWAPGGPGCPAGPYADCDDNDPARFPGNPEICDGKDNNCNGVVDEGFDPDGDGLASCFDNCPNDYNPGQEDMDHDGEGDICDLNDGYIDLRVDASQEVRFQQEQGWAVYDVYRGNLRALADADHDGAADDYGSCLAENLAGPTYDDAAMPPLGDGFYYLVRGRNGLVESPLGAASSGAPRVNVRTCVQVFGFPPVIGNVTLNLAADQATCDFTAICQDWACAALGTAVQASAPIVLGGTYTRLGIQAAVTDPDSTPGQNDVVSVAASLDFTGSSIPVPLYDDGSATSFPAPQRASIEEDCSGAGTGCACLLRTYALASGDATAGDATYSRSVALVPPNQQPLQIDCIMQQTARLPVLIASGTALQIRVIATDRAGHQTTWPDSPAGTVLPATYSCGGDPCGCCLMTASDPTTQCRGLSGMTGPAYPTGVCMSF